MAKGICAVMVNFIARVIMFRFLLVIQSNLCMAFQSAVVNCPLIEALKELHRSQFCTLRFNDS